MSKLQTIIVSIAIVLFAALYFGARKAPLSQKEVELNRAKAEDSNLINKIVGEAKAGLQENELNLVNSIESELDVSGSDSSKLEVFKKLSSTWYELQQFAVSGFYAEEVAQIDQADSAWSIAGYNYAVCFTNNKENEKIFNYCFDKAVAAFENAASLAPDSIVHKENLAYCYTQHNDFSKVMEGVKLYQGILLQDSTNLKVLLRLGKLSVERTKDYPKALKRFEKAIVVAPDNFDANYYLAITYQGLNRMAEAKTYYEKALALTKNQSAKDNIKEILNNL